MKSLTSEMLSAEDANLLDVLDKHNAVQTIRKCICDTLRARDGLPDQELLGLLTAEAVAVRALERVLFPKEVERG